MSKRKIVIFKFGMYEEQISLTEIAKMQRVSEGKYSYIVKQNGQSLTEFKYA